MPNKKQNIRLKQKRKLRHLTLIKKNKLRTLNYKNSILENTWLGQVNKDFSVHIKKDKVLSEIQENFLNKENELQKNMQIKFLKKEFQKEALVNELKEKLNSENLKEEDNIAKNEKENINIENEYIQITKNDLNANLEDDYSRCIIC